MHTPLIEKYNIAAPRYTSYPTVPHWAEPAPTARQWLTAVRNAHHEQGEINLYIHLPYCEQLCTYCGCNKRITKNHAVEQPYIESVLAEWRMYADALGSRPLIKELHLGGGTPTFFAPDSLALLMEGIFAYADRAPAHNFSFEAHPSSTTHAHLAVLHAHGFNRISIGVQDFGQDVLSLINRHQTTEQIYRVVHDSRALGYTSINFDLIFGLPRQSIEHIITNIQHIQHLRPERIAFYGYAHVPWKSPSQRAYDVTDLPQGQSKRDLYETGKHLLLELGYHEIGFDHFALPDDELWEAYQDGHLHRNFMGYTPFDTRLNIALGVSGISDSWDAYVQNEKTIEGYQARIAAGELPITKGHLLTGDEQVIRRHIINILCQEATSWHEPEQRCDDLFIGLDRLAEMEDDGLIRIDAHRLVVYPKGRPYLRNVCLALDQFYWAKAAPHQQQFSQVV